MTDIKLPPYPEGLCLREDIEDYAREAVRLNATVPDEPDWRHPKIQGLIGSEARLRIAIDLIWQILEDPNQEFTASDMEYWDTIHDDLKAALSAAPAAQAVPQGWVMVPKEPTPEMLQIGRHAAPYRAVDVYRAMLSAAPVAPAAPQPAQQPLTVPEGFVPQTCPHCNETWLMEAQQPLTQKDELLRQALEALENGVRVRNAEGGTKYQPPTEEAAIKAIRNHLGVKND